MTPVNIIRNSPYTLRIIVRDSCSTNKSGLATTSEIVNNVTSWILSNFICKHNYQPIRNEVNYRMNSFLFSRERYLEGCIDYNFKDVYCDLDIRHLVHDIYYSLEDENAYNTYSSNPTVYEKSNESEIRRKKLLLLLK